LNGGRLVGLTLVFLALLGFVQLSSPLEAFKTYMGYAAAGDGGGVLGALLTFALLKTIGKVGAVLVFIVLLIIGMLLVLQTSLAQVFAFIRRVFASLRDMIVFHRKEQAPAAQPAADVEEKPQRQTSLPPLDDLPPLPERKRKVPIFTPDDPAPVITEVEEVKPQPLTPKKNSFSMEFLPDITEEKPQVQEIGARPSVVVSQETFREDKVDSIPVLKPDVRMPEPEMPEAEPEEDTAEGFSLPVKEEPTPAAKERKLPMVEDEEDGAFAPAQAEPAPAARPYQLPPVDLIEAGMRVKNTRMNKTITDNIGVLENTLESFGVKATVTQVVAGPSVTRFELQPAPGVKVARITSLADDIALSLAAQGVRIEAPIPGKSAIGIEVARAERDTVYFRELIESDEFQNSQAKLSFALGKNIGGECIIGNLAKMPHLLIAGATGSGKSVCLNTIICSLLYKATPDEVKLMLIDPKKVEMTQYATLPHLIAPVVNDSKKAANALKWVVNEMENRYSLFVGASCKDFEGYNKICAENPLPHIVVIIDELADLMMVAKHDVEDSICRLAQMARAAGIHLVVATQRPSVDVITGLIKANIPSRIAFAVSSFTDSRTILDTAGAEKLLGNGDMLYAPIGRNKPERIQGSFINEKDVNKLVKYCADQANPAFSDAAVKAAEEGAKTAGDRMDDGDELLYDAAMLIISTGQASTSFLQRRLAIGNPRAARLMDMLEAKGVVGGPKGSKPRDILMTAEEVEAMYDNL